MDSFCAIPHWKLFLCVFSLLLSEGWSAAISAEHVYSYFCGHFQSLRLRRETWWCVPYTPHGMPTNVNNHACFPAHHLSAIHDMHHYSASSCSRTLFGTTDQISLLLPTVEPLVRELAVDDGLHSPSVSLQPRFSLLYFSCFLTHPRTSYTATS